MYPTIHDFSATDLATQGHGALSDCISCEVTEELNGEFTLELKYPLNGLHSEYMIPGNIIMVVPSHNQGKQPFRISKIKRSFANNMTVYANHICYDLSGYPAQASVTYSSLSAVISAMNAMTWNTGTSAYNQFSFATDKSSNATFKMEGAQTLRAWMGGKEGSILDTYGGEWSYDGFSCYLASRRGVDTGYRISYGKNLAEYEKEKDFTEYSHICAYWKKSETLVSGNLVSTGLSCPFRCAYYDASNDFENQPTVVQLDSAASAQISGLDIGAQTITITPSQLGNDVIGLGDSVLVCYETIFRTRVVKTVWDSLVGKYIKIQLGSKKTNISDTIKSLTEGPSGESGSSAVDNRLDALEKVAYKFITSIAKSSSAVVNLPNASRGLLHISNVNGNDATTGLYSITTDSGGSARSRAIKSGSSITVTAGTNKITVTNGSNSDTVYLYYIGNDGTNVRT